MRSYAGKSYLCNWDWMLVQRRQNKSRQNLYEVQNQLVSCFFFLSVVSIHNHTSRSCRSWSQVVLFNWSYWCVGTAGLDSVTLYNHRTVSDRPVCCRTCFKVAKLTTSCEASCGNSKCFLILYIGYMHMHICSPLHKYWNSKDKIALLAVESIHLQIWLKDEYETKLHNVTFYY